MLAFYGRMGKRLPDDQGQVCFKFMHISGAVFELKIAGGKPLPKEYDRVIAKGHLVTPGVISAREITAEKDFLTGRASALND